MSTVTNKSKVMSVEEKVTLIREIETGKQTVPGMWTRKFCDTNDLGKT